MVQLKILSGKMAGTSWGTRRFPVRIGRSAQATLQIEDQGVWDEHVELDFKPGEGFILRSQPNALASVNDQAIKHVVLRNGDLIQIGSTKIQFWLSETRQAGLRVREWLIWSGITAICLGQVALVYWLLR